MEKSLLTMNGKIVFSRYVLRPKDEENKKRLSEISGQKTVIPLDCALHIDKLPFKVTASMMLEIAFYAIKLNSYQEAENIIRRIHGIEINDDSVRMIVNFIGRMVFEHDCMEAETCFGKLEEGALDFPRDKDGVLYIETDGAALNTRTKDENGSTWRENKLGLVFSSDNIYYWKDKRGRKQHQILKREYASYVGAVTEFKKHLFSLALRNGYGKYRDTVILSDGAAWIRNIRDELFPDAQQILDFFHLCENTYDFAKIIFPKDETEGRSWAEEICGMLEDGLYKDVLKKIEKYKNKKVPPGHVNLYNYILNNENNIDYPAYKSRGFFVGSGAIESGNKIVLQSRLKQAGMRWNTVTAQYVLSLKAKEESGLWESDVVPLVMRTLG